MTTSPRPYCTEQRPSGRKTLRGPCLGGTGAEQDRVRGHSLARMPPLQSCPREGSGPHGTGGWESRVPMSLPGLPGWMEGAAVCVSGMDGGGCNVCGGGGGEGTDVWGGENWLSTPCALVGAHSPAPGLARSPHRCQTRLTSQPLDLHPRLFCVVS